jgi:signal transduction histidine kinase
MSLPEQDQDAGLSPEAGSPDVLRIQRIAAVPMILNILCETTGMGFAAVARVTETEWRTCAVLDRAGFGLRPGDQLDIATTLCREVHADRKPVLIERVSEDPRYCDHHTPRLYGFQSYLSIPILHRDGSFFGTLCALDARPLPLPRDRLLPTLTLFAELVGAQLDLEEQLSQSRSALLDANEAAMLRDQFIAVLGHDLRNPIAAVAAGLDLLAREPLEGRAPGLVSQMRRSCERMSRLVNDVLDFARGRLGGGIPVALRATGDLGDTLRQVVEELARSHPGRDLRAEIDLRGTVLCDPERIGQLASNLLSNALTHGQPDQPVRLLARCREKDFVLSIGNAGPPIPAEVLPRLFLPFARGQEKGVPRGLGLGLYIASEVARAHGGRLDVASDAAETRFTLTMPLRRPG